jgi:hypothetical protein
MQIETCRTRLEEFEQRLNRELYLYCSGLKERLEIKHVYSDYSDLFSRESIRETELALKNIGESFHSRRNSLEKILRFLIDQHIESHLAPLNQEIALFEGRQSLVWEGKDLSVSQIPGLLRNETDAIKRRKLADRYGLVLNRTEERINAFLEEQKSHAILLGFRNYADVRARISGVDYSKLLKSFENVFSPLESRINDQFHLSFETTLGIPFEEAGSWDVGFWENKNDLPQIFSEHKLIPFTESVISELAIRPEKSEAIAFDLERRKTKRAKPCCIPIGIPHEIKIVLLPDGGAGNYAALLHEIGHAHHFAWTSPALPAEHRIIGDRALSEAYAFLLEYLLLNPERLACLLQYTKSKEFLRFQALYRIFLIRRCIGKLSFALKLYGQDSFDAIPQLYSETMKMHTGLHYQAELWLHDFKNALDAADYLRGWVLESMLSEYLRTKYGNGWTSDRSGSGFLKEIWETGHLYSAEELCHEIGLGDLDPQVLADLISEELIS